MSSRHRLPRGNDGDVAGEKDSAEKGTEQASEAVELTEASETSDATEVSESAEESEAAAESEPAEATSDVSAPTAAKRRIDWARVVAFGLLPAVALLLAAAAGYLKWADNSVRNAEIARIESVQAAKDSTVAMLSYEPDTVEQQLNDARGLLTGEFQESYTGLINDVVIPGAKQKQISTVASVPAAASVSADPSEAVVLVFVNQTLVVGEDAPTDTASSVRVTLEKIDGRWLISAFDPV